MNNSNDDNDNTAVNAAPPRRRGLSEGRSTRQAKQHRDLGRKVEIEGSGAEVGRYLELLRSEVGGCGGH